MLIAYHNNSAEKAAILEQLAIHRAGDHLIKGQYWKNGKGCAVGCTLHSGDHMEYETRFGISVILAHLEDSIFEGLPNAEAQQWPERFMSAVKPGTDLSRVGWQFLHWLLTDEQINPGISHALVRDAVRECAEVILPLTRGEPANSRVRRAARSAAESADSARRAAWRAGMSAAERAAWSRLADKLVELIAQAPNA